MKKLIWMLSLILVGACTSGTPGGGQDATSDAGDVAVDEGNTEPDVVLDAGTDSGTNTIPDAAADVNDDPFAGVDLTPDPNCEGAYIIGTSGSVVGEDNEPIDEAFVQACLVSFDDGQYVCMAPKKTKQDGSFAFLMPDELRCLASVTMRILKPARAVITEYCDMDLTDPNVIVHWEDPFMLYDTYDPTEIPEEGDAEVERTVVLYDGVEIDMIPSKFFSGGAPYEELTSRRLPADAKVCAPKSAPVEFEGIYVFQPEADVFHTTFNTRLPNDYGLEAGDQVDLYVMGGLSCGLLNGDKVGEVEWAHYGVGTVEETGAFIEATGDNGLPCMVWLGLDIPTP